MHKCEIQDATVKNKYPKGSIPFPRGFLCLLVGAPGGPRSRDCRQDEMVVPWGSAGFFLLKASNFICSH